MKSWNDPQYDNVDYLTANGLYHTSTGPSCQFYQNCALLTLSQTVSQYFCTAEKTTGIFNSYRTLIDQYKQVTYSSGDLERILNSQEVKKQNQSPLMICINVG
jgi:hypothetical protein